MNSFELNKILGAVLGHLPHPAGAQYRRRRHLRAGEAEQAGLRDRGQGAGARARKPRRPRSRSSRSRCCWPRPSVEKGQATAKQCQACHTFEKGGPNRVGPNLYGIVGSDRGEGSRRLQFLRRDEGQGRQVDVRRAQQVPHQSARLHPRHRHDLRRPIARPAARRRDRLSAHLSDNPLPLPKAAEQRRPRGEAQPRPSHR